MPNDYPTHFPPSPSCYGCAGRGELLVHGRHVDCSCTMHEAGECDPDGCSPECKLRAARRDGDPLLHDPMLAER